VDYPWENVTVIVPDPEGQAWKNLDLYDKYRQYPRNQDLKPFRKFLHHHFVTRSVPLDKKIKTIAGNRIWWSKVGNESHIYPGDIKILSQAEASNGEVWIAERPLWSEFKWE
jgi:hypothetical protein